MVCTHVNPLQRAATFFALQTFGAPTHASMLQEKAFFYLMARTPSVNTNSIHEIDALGPPPLFLRTTGDKKNKTGRWEGQTMRLVYLIDLFCLPKPHPPNLWHWS